MFVSDCDVISAARAIFSDACAISDNIVPIVVDPGFNALAIS
jgi:hypothetical protein